MLVPAMMGPGAVIAAAAAIAMVAVAITAEVNMAPIGMKKRAINPS